MHRRRFHRSFLAALTAPALLSTAAAAAPRRLIRPLRLRAGDTVGLITPASSVSDESLQKAVTNLESLGLRVKPGAFVRQERGYTAGTEEQRLADLYAMFADPQIQAVWAVRGGYGVTRLLPMIDWQLFRQHPKVFIGYSDITALLNTVTPKTGLVTFHGPVGASEFTDYTREQLTAVLFEGRAPHLLLASADNLASTEPGFERLTIRPGVATGPLVGGNLSLLSAMIGTPYQPEVEGKILFMEDIGEKPYRIDRMLTQLRQALPLEKTAGIAFGICADCQPEEGDRSLTLLETLTDRLGDLGVPVCYGLSFGHIKDQFTLPVGVPARFDATNMQLTLLEAGVV